MGCDAVHGPLEKGTEMITSIDHAAYVTFVLTWESKKNTDWKFLRVGQAFHQYFSLEKSTQYKTEFDKLYQLDGCEAWERIGYLFYFS